MEVRTDLQTTVLDVGQVSASTVVAAKTGYEIDVWLVIGSFKVSVLFGHGSTAYCGAIDAPTTSAGPIPFGTPCVGGTPHFVVPAGEAFTVTTGTSGSAKGLVRWSYRAVQVNSV